jgi:hypothetical protein
MLWKQQIPLLLCFIFGTFAIITYFSPQLDPYYQEYILNWTLIIFGFSMGLGIWSLLLNHFRKIFRQVKGWQYNLVAITGYFSMVFIGFVFGRAEDSTFQYLFQTIMVPVQSTMFSILAFYIASAAFRAFRARTLEATLLLIAAIIVMLGQVPLGAENIPYITELKDWIMNFPNMAAKRGIWIGVGLGVMSTALKIILGIERTYLGSTGGGN